MTSTESTASPAASTDTVPVPEDNSHAGQGPVVLDIGGEIGALIVTAPESLIGVEIEIKPTGDTPFPEHLPHTHEHTHGHAHDDTHEGHHLVHVAVVVRPSPAGPVPTAVYGELHEGTYELYVRPDGPVQLEVTIVGGEVTLATWPA